MSQIKVNAKEVLEALNATDKVYCDGMRAYIRQWKEMPSEKAKIEAEKALFRTGVIDKNGNVK